MGLHEAISDNHFCPQLITISISLRREFLFEETANDTKASDQNYQLKSALASSLPNPLGSTGLYCRADTAGLVVAGCWDSVPDRTPTGLPSDPKSGVLAVASSSYNRSMYSSSWKRGPMAVGLP